MMKSESNILVNALLAAMLQQLGDAPVIVSGLDVARFSRRNLRIESVPGAQGGVLVRVMPDDPVLLARLAHHDLQRMEGLSAREPRNPQVQAAVQGAKTAYGEALAALSQTQLAEYVLACTEPVPEEILSPPNALLIPYPVEPPPEAAAAPGEPVEEAPEETPPA